MSSSLRVNTIVPSTGTNVAIGTANGTVTFTDSVNFVLGTGSSIFSPASNTLTFGTNDAERLRITSSGNIGIGTDNPSTGLHLMGADAYFTMQGSASDSNAGILFKDSAGTQNSVIFYDFDDDYLKFSVSNDTEALRIDSNGRISVNSNANASDSNEGAQLRVTGTPITRNQYYSPAGDYYGSFGYTDNTYTKSWIAVDSSYNKASAVSSGIFLSAFHSDANGSACGHTIKNVRTDAGGLIFSSVHAASSTGNPAVETERLRITTAGTIKCGTSSTLKAEINSALGGHQFISQCNDNNNGFEIYQQHGSTTTRNTFAVYANTGSGGAQELQFSIRGDGCVTKPTSPAFSASLSSGNINAANYNNVIIFNNQHFDNSNSYNTSNGRFTAPVAGKYYFGVQIYAGFDFSGVRVLHAKFQKNGSDFATADMFGGSSNHGGNYYHPTGCGHILIDLAVNDWVAFNSGGFSAGGTGNALIYAQSGTRFFGYLVG